MIKVLKSLLLLVVVGLFGQTAVAAGACNTIQSGLLVDSRGLPIRLGFDTWGYNYQARIFNGLYDNYSRPNPPVAVGDIMLQMKWSDNWLSNQDCSGDNKLDRGTAGSSNWPTNSEGWLTNHMEGDYLGSDNQMHHFTYFVKIVYMPPENCEPLKLIWNTFCIIEEIQNDPYGEFGGKLRSKVVPAGLGVYTN